jgi:hypothetical protein
MPRRTRGLLRTIGRTAAIAGTATAVSGRMAHRQNQKFAQQQRQHPQAAVAEPSSGDDLVVRLQQLADLKASGALSAKEFAAAKARLLRV